MKKNKCHIYLLSSYRRLENTNVICRILEIFPYIQKYLKWLLDEKKTPKNDERFPQIQSCFSDSITPAL